MMQNKTLAKWNTSYFVSILSLTNLKDTIKGGASKILLIIQAPPKTNANVIISTQKTNILNPRSIFTAFLPI